MCTSISNIQISDENGGNALHEVLLNTTAKSSRKNWFRIFYVFVQIGIFKVKKRDHISIGISGAYLKPEEAARIVRERDLDSLRNHIGDEQVLLGLSPNEEQAAARISAKHTVEAKDLLKYLLKACKSPTHFALLVAASLSFTTEMVEQGPKYGWHDGVAILGALFMLITFRTVAGYRRARELQKKLEKMSKLEVRVERRGVPQTISVSDLVVGDILRLNKGEFVPADGLFVDGNGLMLDDQLDPEINHDQNPFLFSGSEVVDGEGRMLVTSVGTDTVLSRARMPDHPDEKTWIEAQIDKTNAYMENVSLLTSLLVSGFVLFNLVFRKMDKKSNPIPDLKRDVSLHELIKILQMAFFKPRGKVQILTSALAAVATSVQHGMPFVIAISLSHWKKKMVSAENAHVQTLSSCGTIGNVSVICFDLKIMSMTMHGDVENDQFESQEVIKTAIEDVKNAGVCCMLVSKYELPHVNAMALELGIINSASNSMAIEGKDLDQITFEARMEEVAVIGNCQVKDKICILKRLKEGGHVVAFIGGMTATDALALKEADVGITWNAYSTKMTRDNSDLIISSVSSLSPILKIGGCAYRNIQTFTQIQLSASLCGLLITLVTTIVLDESPITGFQLIWVNCIICILGGIIMVMEFQVQEQQIINNPPARTQSLLTPTIWRNVLIRVVSDAFYLLMLQFIGKAIIQVDTGVVKTMIFNGFTLCQVFNQFVTVGYTRSDAYIVMRRSYWLLMAMGTVMAMQVLLVEFLQSLADYETLNLMQWGFCFIYAACLCGFGVAVRFVADSASDESWRSIDSQLGFLRRRTGPQVLLMGIPFSIFLVASFSYYVNPVIARTFR